MGNFVSHIEKDEMYGELKHGVRGIYLSVFCLETYHNVLELSFIADVNKNNHLSAF